MSEKGTSPYQILLNVLYEALVAAKTAMRRLREVGSFKTKELDDDETVLDLSQKPELK